MVFTSAEVKTAILTVDGRATTGGVVELPPNARLLLDVIVDSSGKGESPTEAAMTQVDSNAASAFRVQQDARLLAAIADADTATTLVSEPAGFSWTNSPLNGRIFKDARGRFSTSFDITTLKNATTGTYYITTTGLDTNDGLTEGTAFKTLGKALDMAGVNNIMIKAGTYNRLQWVAGASNTKSANVIGYGGDVILANHDTLTWELTVGQTYTYEAARSAVGNVGDISTGIPGVRYGKKASIAQVEASPGSWYTDGAKVYVHTFDNRAADSNVHAYLTTGNLKWTADGATIYLENLILHGGDSALDVRNASSAGGTKVYMNKVRTGYSGLQNNMRIIGANLAVSVDCDSYHSFADGFNYHIFNTVVPKFVEVNCRGFSNGGASNSDQGSTAHDGVKGIRLNGKYWDNHSHNITDVNDDTETWNLGVSCRDARGGIDFYSTTGAPKMWLDGCTGQGSLYSAHAVGAASLLIRDSAGLERTINTGTY